jgi:two-component system sensor histidine kinase TorS
MLQSLFSIINFAGDRTGVVEGSCRVSILDSLLRRESPGDSWRVLLTDRKQRVLIGGNFEYPPLTPLAGTSLGDFIRRPTAGKADRHTADIRDERISFLSVSVPVPRAGWTITVQRKWGDILAPITGVYLALIAVAMIAALVAVGFTAWSIRDFLSAWSGLLEFARDPIASSGRLNASRGLNLPREFNDLLDHLSAMADRLKSERNQREQLLAELESRVQTRTQELQKALVAAQAADRAKSAFLATVSHELRTPLTSIITGTELLKLNPTARTQMEERTLRTMEKSSQVLMSVISDVLDYSKLEAGSVNITRAPFPPATVVADVLTILNPAARKAGLSLVAEIGHPHDFEWNGDATHVRQVLVNLVGNAVKFTTAGTVKVSTRITGGTVKRLHFSVQDSGRGIPAEQLESIFEPFVQLPQGRVLSQAGTGLGLPISRKLVQAMGGEISVSSRQGEGSTFEFWIS